MKKTDMTQEEGRLSVEECFDRLEELLSSMESDKTGLEETFRLYEQGLKLLKTASESINSVEKQIRILNEEEQHELH
ncbi:MAG: exodeoxyribonuclease VII small subunit [Clostridiales bacterium]|nr:exodeoxyribonuclease VII small subunit [Clostridiales bacterium]